MDRTKNNLKTDRKTDGYEPIFTSVPSTLLIPVYMFPLLFKLHQNLNLTSDSSRKGVGSNGGTRRKSCFLTEQPGNQIGAPVNHLGLHPKVIRTVHKSQNLHESLDSVQIPGLFI